MKGKTMFEKPKKTKVKWHGKTVIMPFNCSVYQDKEVEIANRFTGEKTKMPGYAASVYDTIIGAERFEANPDRIFIGGTSAGGHITGMVLAGGWHDEFGVPADCVKGALALNGLYDLEPVRLSEPNEWAQLDKQAAYRNSPIHHLPEDGCPLIVSFGGSETAEFKRQSNIYAAAWRDRGWRCSEFEVSECNHFNIPQQLRDPATRLCQEMFSMIGTRDLN